MCGITGLYSRKSELPKNLINEMTLRIEHRGPDAQGLFHAPNNKVALGHRRLSIIDLSDAANQPMHTADGKFTIVFNGEVYNFDTLRDELIGLHHCVFTTASDTEVILQAYQIWGKSFVKRLNGMFAIAIYNNVKDEIFIARDRVGIKPLYYYYDEELFAFASELKALTALIPHRGKFTLDLTAMNYYFRLGYVPEPHAIYNEIKKFPSGNYAHVNKNGFKVSSYWKLADKVTKKMMTNEKEAKSKLNDLICDSVSLRLKSDVPFGVFLSGGVDSSTVAAVAQHVNPSSISTFSIGFNEAKYNESKHAEDVAKKLNTNHASFTVSHKDAQDLMGGLQTMFDEPFADASAIPTFLVSKLAREQVKMVLTGDGGDEQFLGYGMYQWARRLDSNWYKIGRRPVKSALKLSKKPRLLRVAEVLDYKKGTELMSHVFSTEQYLFSEAGIKTILDKKFVKHFSFEEPQLARDLNPMEKQAFFDLNYYLKDDLLVKVDRASMKASLEARVPLLDYRIVEFSLNLSPDLKWKNNIAKYLLKEVMYDYLPKELMERPKWGFGLPIRIWLANELVDLLETYINKKSLKQCVFLNGDVILDLKRRYLAGEDQLYNKLWLVMMFLQWHDFNKQYIKD